MRYRAFRGGEQLKTGPVRRARSRNLPACQLVLHQERLVPGDIILVYDVFWEVVALDRLPRLLHPDDDRVRGLLAMAVIDETLAEQLAEGTAEARIAELLDASCSYDRYVMAAVEPIPAELARAELRRRDAWCRLYMAGTTKAVEHQNRLAEIRRFDQLRVEHSFVKAQLAWQLEVRFPPPKRRGPTPLGRLRFVVESLWWGLRTGLRHCSPARSRTPSLGQRAIANQHLAALAQVLVPLDSPPN